MPEHEGDPLIEAAARPAAWLAVAEASRTTGWNPERLRSLARRGTIVCRRGNRGLEILVEDGRPRSHDGRPQPDGRPGRPLPEARPASDGEARADRLEAAVERLRDDLARAERESTALRIDVARAEERIKAVEAVARGDVEAAKRVVEVEIAAKEEVLLELRAQIAREVARGDTLVGELAALRRPWWQRVFG